MVFELILCDLAQESYGLFFNVMQKHEIDVSAMVTDCYRNGHIITCVFILLNYNEVQKILYTQTNQFI